MALIDGMGFEEVNQPGSALNNIWTNGSVLAETFLSGGSVFAQGPIGGENVYGDTTVSGATVKGATISGTNIVNSEGKLRSVGTGSGTSVFGALVQAGSSALSSNTIWVVYPTAYTGKPSVSIHNITAEGAMRVCTTTAGSFQASGTNTSDEFTWMSIGI